MTKFQRTCRQTALCAVLMALVLTCALPLAAAQAPEIRIEVSFPASVHAEPITGRAFVILSQKPKPEPRLQVGFWGDAAPMFGVDVSRLKPGASTVIDAATLGYPVKSLRDLPAGDYYVQGLLNVYTEFHRSDGHVIWAHEDHWEGQQFNRSPGNLYSPVEKVHLDPAAGLDLKLSLTKTIPPVEMPKDTEWVKHIKIQSPLLTRFWGRPVYLGATVLLPRGYETHPEVRYPVIYYQDHFTLRPPFPFATDKTDSSGWWGERGYDFYQEWISDGFPRMIAIRFQHPTPYFDDSYAVNSANNGPYGDAILTELIPYLEEHFRIIRKPYARVLTGGSTGGWESLALQVYHPGFFGGTWTFYPDPVDFSSFQLIDIYSDPNAFYEPGHKWLKPPRYMMRKSNGQPEVTVEQMSRLEAVLGSHGRSAQQMDAFFAVFGPAGPDGYPERLWDYQTGAIHRDVAEYMRDHGYDLHAYLEENWPTIGPELKGKIHVYVGDMDNFYLNLAVYKLQALLESETNPPYEGSFQYGRPMKGHGWSPMTHAELIRAMAEHITRAAPPGEDTSTWKY